MTELTEGSLKTIMQGGEVSQPIMQVLGCKKIPSNSTKERFRLLLSDGKYQIAYAMLTNLDTSHFGPNGIESMSVIKIKKYITSIINNREKGDSRILLILEFEILRPGSEVGEKIGSPVTLSETNQSPAISNGSSSNATNGNVSSSNAVSKFPARNTNMDTSNNVSLNGHLTNPIVSLSPYHNKWIIKARVFNKSAVRSWSNSRGEGKLFSIDLIDESGEIRCTGFKEAVDKFYDYIQVDKVYYISKCILKPANKQFNNLKNDYEMTMTSDTILEECLDADAGAALPQTQYSFTPIDKIAQTEVNAIVDVIGVCKHASDLQTFQAKSTGRELKKKEVILIDQSQTAVALTLWGSEAENFDDSSNPVVVLKGARVGEYGGGKNLSTVGGTLIKLNPEIAECFRMRAWFDTEGKSVEATNISARSGAGGSFQTPWMSFKEVQDQGLGKAEKGDYYQVKATVLMMRSENAMYKACPTEDCNKKVVDMENGMFRCEKCNREFPNYKWRLLASMNVGDWSGNQWISMFSKEVETVLGMTADEVGRMVEEKPASINDITDRANFKQFIMKCRAKMEIYNDESRLKTVCIKVDPINYEEYNAHLIDSIQQLMS